jgi:anti-sigma factor RsiW
MEAYGRGELSGKRARRIASHLSRCAVCAARYRDETAVERALTSELGKACAVLAPRPSWEDFRARLEKEAVKDSAESRWSRLSGDVASLLGDVLLPSMKRQVAECAYWGKRLSLPALSALLVLFLFKAFHAPDNLPARGPAPGTESQIVIRISFQPAGERSALNYYADSGKKFGRNKGLGGELMYGWR